MGTDALSRAEVSSLLGDTEPVAGQAAGLRRVGSERAPVEVRYDFRHAERVGIALARKLESLHESAARDFAAALAGFARCPVGVQVAGIEQVTYAEFVRQLASPTCFSLIKAEPLAANLALDISPTIVYPIIDRLLGGVHDSAQAVDRPLTGIERRLASRVVALWLDALRRSWRSLLAVEFELLRVETDPRLAGLVSPSELVMAVRYELTLGKISGPMALCIPFTAIDSLRAQIVDPGRSGTDAAHSPADVIRLQSTTVQLVAELAHVKIAVGELAGLRAGDIITTDQDIHSPLAVEVDGRARFHARLGAYKGRKAICIEGTIEPPGTPT